MQTVRIAILTVAAWFAATSGWAQEPSDPRQRQAAAEAYDQGTAAYLSGDYVKAAEWFETANRLSPAAPALIQAARSLQQAGQPARAATLSLRLITEYAAQPAALEFGEKTLEQLSGRLVRVEVTCQSCTIDVDGSLQEWSAFYLDPDAVHTVTASFETGSQKAEVSAPGGATVPLSFEAPPPPIPSTRGGKVGAGDDDTIGMSSGSEAKPLPPLVAYIGMGLTAALLAGSIASGVDMQAGVDDYESSAQAWRDRGCSALPRDGSKAMTPECKKLYDPAHDMLEVGQSKQTRTTVLWIATGAVAATTLVFALFFTDWDGDHADADSAHALRVGVVPGPESGALVVKGQF